MPISGDSLCTVQLSESSSGLFGGVALDDLHLTIRQVGFMMTGGAGLMSCIWLPYAIRNFVRYKREVKASQVNHEAEP